MGASFATHEPVRPLQTARRRRLRIDCGMVALVAGEGKARRDRPRATGMGSLLIGGILRDRVQSGWMDESWRAVHVITFMVGGGGGGVTDEKSKGNAHACIYMDFLYPKKKTV